MAVQRIIIETIPTNDAEDGYIGYVVEGPKQIRGAWGDESWSHQEAFFVLRDRIRGAHPRSKFEFIHAAL
jgi:hypothetical protein